MLIISTYLNFLIALVFIIALCSTILSIIYEAISYYMRSRSVFLKKAIQDVLNDTVHEGQLNLTELFYAHPQIDLTKKTYRHLPAYISSQNFAQTLVDTLCNKHIRDNLQIKGGPNEIATVIDQKELRDAPQMKVFIESVNALDYCDLKILLSGFISNSEENLDRLHKNIAQWFDEYMNRVSGWYKIKVQKQLFLLAVIVCFSMNMDIFNISKKLINDKNLTEQIAQAAAQYNPPTQIDSITNATEFQHAIELKNNIVDSLYLMNAPVFWQYEKIGTGTYWLNKVFGCLIMALALSFGSPFWFGVLNKLVNIRKTGIKPSVPAAPGNN